MISSISMATQCASFSNTARVPLDNDEFNEPSTGSALQRCIPVDSGEEIENWAIESSTLTGGGGVNPGAVVAIRTEVPVGRGTLASNIRFCPVLVTASMAIQKREDLAANPKAIMNPNQRIHAVNRVLIQHADLSVGFFILDFPSCTCPIQRCCFSDVGTAMLLQRCCFSDVGTVQSSIAARDLCDPSIFNG